MAVGSERPPWTSFEDWEQYVPPEIRNDALWKMKVYRLALFASDIGWFDIGKLIKDHRTRDIAGQLYRSLGSECANIEEGYPKASHRDRSRFYEYALGSARESRGWYYRSRFILSERVIAHRIQLQTEIIRLLLSIVPRERRATALREPAPVYQINPNPAPKSLLTNIPFE